MANPNAPLVEEDLIKSRPLLFESRPFSRLTKRQTTLSSSIIPPNPHAEIDLDFTYFTAALTRIQLLLSTNTREVSRYSNDKASILSRSAEAKETLISLRDELTQAQSDKQNKLVYDKIAGDILSIKTLKARDEQHANIDRLNEEIRELEEERQLYETVWKQRREQFGMIVGQLEVMSRQIAEEKEEQDRRDGMEEEEEEGEEVEIQKGTPAQMQGTPHTPRQEGATPMPVEDKDEKEEGEEEEGEVEIRDEDRMDTS
ncbi:Similar to Uncharacterized protein SPCC24B10.11c; acc. no. Q9P7J4 [Pyronema omphalodes CBS 100304]|uniref:Similar to Uncharacterized protein SPCC24B10.11c acc. no. Q9P7J4 n=1 Tax=Pyronema omphalodes (strain CBS 100304) TaxID=1076935 RepID=U4LJ89_PYROM|nr:Similar to Uncharacterized protein SPCC24B10.11c; acc. no. Q9P7J4 [Pyronema omphalodes CBS 100304]